MILNIHKYEQLDDFHGVCVDEVELSLKIVSEYSIIIYNLRVLFSYTCMHIRIPTTEVQEFAF